MSTLTHEDHKADQLHLVKKSYFVGFWGSILIVILGLSISFLFNEFYPLSNLSIGLFQAFSIVPGATALLGVRDIHTWSGRSHAENLNQKLFKRFSLAGLFLPVMAFSLQPASDITPKIDNSVIEKLKSDILQELAQKNSTPPVEFSIQEM